MGSSHIVFVVLATIILSNYAMNIDVLDVSSMEPVNPNYCNNSETLEEAGLVRATLGQFLGYECSQEFYHCRWQSDGFRTYRKQCKTGLVYDVLGTQNCNYDYNVKSCGMRGEGPVSCNQTDFHCALSGQCVPLSKRCDGRYDCGLEEDEQNCPLCTAGEFACIISEQCISLERRCNGIAECSDGTDERDCDVCGHGLFHCAKSGECVPIDERCDGRRQCPHGEDEMLCKKPSSEKKFTCQSRVKDIPMNQVCDGAAQCPDGSDEMYCEMGVAAGGSISFSSNPNPSQPAPEPRSQPKEEEKEEYDYEEVPDEESTKQGPSFPMLSLMTMAPPRIVQPAPAPTTRITIPPPPPSPAPTTAPPPPVAQPSQARPAFSKPKPRIMIPQEMKPAVSVRPQSQPHKIVQPNYVAVTASPATQSTASRLSTSARVTIPSSPSSKRVRYPTKSVSEMVEPRAHSPSSAPAVHPRSQNPQQMFARPASAAVTDTGRTYEVSPYTTPQHAVVVEVTSPPRGLDVKSELLQQLGAQINNGMSPDLMSKIEKLLTDELTPTTTRRRRPTGARDNGLSPSAILRTFTSRVQKINK